MEAALTLGRKALWVHALRLCPDAARLPSVFVPFSSESVSPQRFNLLELRLIT